MGKNLTYREVRCTGLLYSCLGIANDRLRGDLTVCQLTDKAQEESFNIKMGDSLMTLVFPFALPSEGTEKPHFACKTMGLFTIAFALSFFSVVQTLEHMRLYLETAKHKHVCF